MSPTGLYGKPRRIEELVDLIVARILDHPGIAQHLVARWGVAEAAGG